ncbi:unnamed protein product [Symbiodinium sp. KB8]|nr:unnamed protein product [Symbiodinium sp. KB8]
MTLYVPMRDGLEAGMVGLFADWRDICVPTHLEDATILGVLLDVADILRLRRWSVFDAVRKGERTVVNFDLRDSRRHDGFRQVPEAFWRSGRQVSAWSQWEWLYQPLQFDIVEEHSQRWCVHLRMSYQMYPPSWCRRFLRAFQDAAWDVVFQPLQHVHKPFVDA